MNHNTLYRFRNVTVGGEKNEADAGFAAEPLPERVITYSKYDIRRFERKNSLFDELIKAVDKLPVHSMNCSVLPIKESNKAFYTTLLKAAKVFNFDVPTALHGITTATSEAALLAFYNEPLDTDSLGLPFMFTAVVTPDCAVILHKVDGTDKLAGAMTYLLLSHMHGDRLMTTASFGLLGWKPDAAYTGDVIARSIYTYVFVNGKHWKLVDHARTNTSDSLFSPVLGKAMSLVTQLNTPDRFILETAPVNPGVRSKKFIPRSHQRPEYILLHPSVIRQYMKTEHETDGKSKRGHERRAHNRRYPDDPVKFPKAHGKTVRIEAMWIGTTEAVVGDRRYKVILDV